MLDKNCHPVEPFWMVFLMDASAVRSVRRLTLAEFRNPDNPHLFPSLRMLPPQTPLAATPPFC